MKVKLNLPKWTFGLKKNWWLFLILGFTLSCQKDERVIFDKLMTYERYQNMVHQVPYIFEFEDNQSKLLYYGTRHSFNPKDSLHDNIEAKFVAFQPDIAFNEGGNPPVETDRDSSIIKYGEAGLLRYLGKMYNVPVRNADLPIEKEIEILTKTYTKQQLLLFYTVRQLGSYNSMEEPPEFANYFLGYFNYLRQKLDMPDAGWPIVQTEFKKEFGMEIKPKQVTSKLTDPVPQDNLTQRISRDSSIARDKHIINTILKAMKQHGKVFVLMGASHVVMQEPVFKAKF